MFTILVDGLLASQSPSSGACLRTKRSGLVLPSAERVAIAFERRMSSDISQDGSRLLAESYGRNRLRAAHVFGLHLVVGSSVRQTDKSQSPSSGACLRTSDGIPSRLGDRC